MQFCLFLLLCVSIVIADEASAQQPAAFPESQQNAIEALEKLGGRLFKQAGQVPFVVLSGTRVTDADLTHLKELPGITRLQLNRTAITDEGLVHLKDLPNLRYVTLADTRVTDAGIKNIQAALPDCRILRTTEPPPRTPDRGGPRRTPSSISSAATGTYNRARVLILESVRNELELSDEQKIAIDRLLAEWTGREEERNSAEALPQSPEEARKLATESRQDGEDTWTKIQQLLTAEQRKRFDQLTLQQSGFRVFIFVPGEVSGQLRLTTEQRARFRGIYADWERDYGMLPRSGTKTWDKLMARFLDVFTEAQREQWKELTGEPFDFNAPPAGSRARGFSYTFPRLGGDADWLHRDWVQTELKLTEAQTKAITNLLEEWQRREDEIQQTFRNLSQSGNAEEMRQVGLVFSDFAIELTDRMTAVLTPVQKTRLEQLQLQERGLQALIVPSEHQILTLTPKQSRDLNLLFRDLSATPTVGRIEPTSVENREELMAKAFEVLTEEQRQKWNEAIGEPFEFPQTFTGTAH